MKLITNLLLVGLTLFSFSWQVLCNATEGKDTRPKIHIKYCRKINKEIVETESNVEYEEVTSNIDAWTFSVLSESEDVVLLPTNKLKFIKFPVNVFTDNDINEITITFTYPDHTIFYHYVKDSKDKNTYRVYTGADLSTSTKRPIDTIKKNNWWTLDAANIPDPEKDRIIKEYHTNLKKLIIKPRLN